MTPGRSLQSDGPGGAFRLREANLSDAPAMSQICMEAFASGPIARGLHGHTGYSDAGRASMQAGMENDLRAGNSSTVRYVVAELADNCSNPASMPSNTPGEQSCQTPGTLIGFAKWHFYPDPAKSAHAPTTVSSSSLGEGTNLDLAQAFFGGCHELRQRYIEREARRHCILTILAVSPTRRGLGAGSALLGWGTDLADREGLDCWLTSTPVGYGVYRRAGFGDVDVLDLDLGRWGLGKVDGEDWGEMLAVDGFGGVGGGLYRVVLMCRRALNG